MRQWLESGRAGTRSRDELERSFYVCRDCGVEDDAALGADQLVVMFGEFLGQFEPLEPLSRCDGAQRTDIDERGHDAIGSAQREVGLEPARI